ncbi:MAG: helix-turn-helix transcriptional regulator [Clostridia bacterium]|nr:helix-turn-helix transcriptional regulator [Clostridia bacterium]
MQNIKPEQKYHFEKNYAHDPLKIGNISLIQIGCTHCSQDFSIAPHSHRNWFEITYVTGGEGSISTNGVGADAKRGDLYISFPGDLHAIYSDNENPLKYSFLSFFTEDNELKKELEQIMILNNDPNRRAFTDENIEKLIDNCISEVILNDRFSEDMLSLCLNQIIRYLIRDFSLKGKAEKLKISSSQELCYRMTNYIRTHIYSMNSLEELAEYFGYSYGYLSGVYHNTTGDTLVNCYTSNKANTAKALINEGMLSFTEIAELLNFSSIYSFSRAFKNHFGITPSEYKKQIKNTR